MTILNIVIVTIHQALRSPMRKYCVHEDSGLKDSFKRISCGMIHVPRYLIKYKQFTYPNFSESCLWLIIPYS